MRKLLASVMLGVLLAVAAQTFIAVAETWSFGPSLRPLQIVFGIATFPVVTAVSLGVPIGLLFFLSARVMHLHEPTHLLALIAPFAFLQLVGLFGSTVNAYALFYTLAFVGMGAVGVVASRALAKRAAQTSGLGA